jgi:phage gp29-like protein
MSVLDRMINAIRRPSQHPRPGRVAVPRAEDSVRDYPGAGLTPSRLSGILREADDGSLDTAMQLFEEMEEKDAHLYCVANTRRLALTGLPWEVVSAATVREAANRASADEAAHYCSDVLHDLDSFEEALQHLSLAVGRNIAVAEIGKVAAASCGLLLAPVDFTRIVFDALIGSHLLKSRAKELRCAAQVHRACTAVGAPASAAGCFGSRRWYLRKTPPRIG